MSQNDQVKAKDLMTIPVYVARHHMSVEQVMEMLIDNGISGAPVVDVNNRVISVVTEFDLMKLCASGMARKMMSDVLDSLPSQVELKTVDKSSSFVHIFKMFQQYRIRRILVVDSTGRLQGIISRRDVIRLFLDDLRFKKSHIA